MTARALWARRLPDIRQSEAAECGLACLAMIASYHGQQIDLGSLRRRYPVSLKGMTLAGVIEAAERIGLAGRPLRLEPVSLARLRLPAILHWDMSHFVVLKRIARNGRAVIHDPALGERQLGVADLSNHFSGVALEITPSSGFQPGRQVVKQRLSGLIGSAHGLLSPLVQTLVLSVILQAYVLAGPFYMQLAVDEGVVNDDRSLLSVFALGFGLAMLFNAVAGLLRSRILVYLQSRIAFDIGNGLFAHLLRLPLVFFERRHIGDLVSRFSSIEPIRNLLAEGLISALVDGAMAVLTAGNGVPVQCKAWVGRAHGIAHLRRAAGGLLSDVPATLGGRRAGPRAGKLNVHRNRARHTEHQDLQSRERAKGAVVEPLR